MFVGFATVPGFVSFTSEDGSPYLQVGHMYLQLTPSNFCQQALAQELAERHATADLSDIHLLVKVGWVGWGFAMIKSFPQRKLAMMRLGEEGVRQGAEERSSLLSKLLFSRQPILDFFDFEPFFLTS